MAHHQKIGVHRVESHGRVDQRLALFDRACLHRHAHHIRTEALARELETGLGAGGGFEEHVDLGEACERVGMFGSATAHIGILPGQIEQRGDIAR